MISVIVPVYNSENYLSECIDSLINQTYKNFELILVDDGSTDKSARMCDEYAIKDSRIKVVHKENGGVSSARNVGLQLSQGEYIQFVDSDDYVKPEFLSILINSIEQNNSQISVCKASTIHINGTKSKSKSKVSENITLDRKEATSFLFNEMNNALWNKLISKDAIKDIIFEEGCTFGEDPYFLIQVLNNCERVSFVADELYCYRKNEGSITTTKFSEKKFDQVYFKDKMYYFIQEYFPDLIPLAKKWRFTSRLNICRMLYLNDMQNQYKTIRVEYSNFMHQEYKEVKFSLSKKEKTEYFLFRFSKLFYCLFIKTVFKR